MTRHDKRNARPARAPLRHPRRGLTLIELMVAMAVMVVLMSVAVPSLSEFSASNQVVAAKSAFAAAVALARTEAAKRGTPVIVQAIGSAAAGNEFANGWEIVLDQDGDGSAGASEPRLRRFPALASQVRLGGPTRLGFRASGALSTPSAQTFTICRSSGSGAGYSITVTPSGVADVATINGCG